MQLKDVAQIISMPFLPSERGSKKAKIITPKNISASGQIDKHNLPFQHFDLIQKKGYLKQGDILVQMVHQYQAIFINQTLAKTTYCDFYSCLRVNKDLILPAYLFQILSEPSVEIYLNKKFRGEALRRLPLYFLESLEITVPSLEEQERLLAKK